MRIESRVWFALRDEERKDLLRTHGRVEVVYTGFVQEVTLGGSERLQNTGRPDSDSPGRTKRAA